MVSCVFIKQFLAELDRILEEDKKLCDVLMHLKDAHRNPKLEGSLILSGSSVEGCLLPRWFRPSSVKEVEADVMYLIAVIPPGQKHRIEDVQGQPGHVRLPYGLIMENLTKPDTKAKYTHYLEHHERYPVKEDPQYLSPVVCRALAQKLVTLRDPDGITEQVVARLWEAKPENVTVKQEYGITGASAMDSIVIKIQGNAELKLSIDHVGAVRLGFLPDVLKPWLDGSDRNRKWPSPGMLAKMAAMGCYVVPKSSKDGDEETEWRFSFSIIEMFLAAMRNQNPNVKRSYFVVKSIFYNYLEPLDIDEPRDDEHKALASFLAKTVLMWACDEHPPMEDDLWKDGNLLKSVDYILEQLQQRLENGFLPYYFISNINLLRDYDERLLKMAASKIAEIRSDLMRHLPKGIDSETAMAANVTEKLANVEQVATPLVQMALFMKNLKHLCEDALGED